MNTLDIVIIIILSLGLVHGLFKGLILGVTTLLALVLGIWGAARFSYFSASFLSDRLDWNGEAIHIAALGLTFLGIVFLVNIIGKLVDKLASAIALGLINRILGGVFGLLKAVILLSLMIAALHYFRFELPFVSEELRAGSVFYGMLDSVSGLFVSWFGGISI